MTIAIDIQTDGVRDLFDDLRDLGPAFERALNRTVRKVTRTVASRAGRAVAKQNRVPVRALTKGGSSGRGKRVYQRAPKRGSAAGSVWVGFNPIGAGYVGRPVQTRAGARVKGRQFPGAFVATMKSGHRSIWSRVNAQRLPISEERVELEQVEQILDKVAREGGERLRQVLLAEINYELNVR